MASWPPPSREGARPNRLLVLGAVCFLLAAWSGYELVRALLETT